MKNIVLFVIISYFASLTTAETTLSPLGANVCRRTYTYSVRLDCDPYIPPGENLFVYRCCINPPECTRFRDHNENRPTYQTKLGAVCECCAGYDQVADACVPFCPANCIDHGTCVTPYRCRCDAGWTGISCSKAEINTNTQQETLLMYMLGAFSVACGIVLTVVMFFMWRFRKDYLKSARRREANAQRCRLRRVRGSGQSRAVENIYEANPTPKPFVTNLEPSYENYEYSTDIESPAEYSEALYGVVEEDTYQDLSAFQKPPFSLMKPLYQNYEASSDLQSSAGCSTMLEGKEKNGSVEDIYQGIPNPKSPFPLLEPLCENYEDSSVAGHLPVYVNLDVENNERENDREDQYIELKR